MICTVHTHFLLSRCLVKTIFVVCFLQTAIDNHAQVPVVTVAADGSGNFASVQAAVNSLPDHAQSKQVVYIKNGTYYEKVHIPSWKTNVVLIGEDKHKTIISWNDHAGKGNINTFTSYTILVQGNGFAAENLTIENTAGREAGQAVALHVEADRCVIKNCRIVGNQDTLYAGVDNSRQYYKDCYIEGTTDFIFGPATAVFENCTIHCKKNSYITAASTPQHQPYGMVFFYCSITTAQNVQGVYLGRPWRPYAKTVFIECELDERIRPEGWHNWNKPDAERTAFYAEYKSTGKGANPEKRVTWSRQLTDTERKEYTLEKIFGNWKPN